MANNNTTFLVAFPYLIRGIHKVSFPLVPQLINHLLYEVTACTSRVLTVTLLQWLKMGALIPAPADCEVQSMIKFLNAQSIAPIKISLQLCHVYAHIRLDSQHISCRSSARRCLIIIHPTARPGAQWFTSFLIPHEILVQSVTAFLEWKRGRGECHSGYNPRRQSSTTGYKNWPHAMTNVSILEMNMLNHPINLSH